MNTEDLLKPRYKVIATFPFNDHFMQGEIITLTEFDSRSHIQLREHFTIQQPLSKAGHVHPVTMYESTFNQYPHLFKKLEWWEERKLEEMPEYLRTDNRVYKVKEYESLESNSAAAWFDSTKFGACLRANVQPATKEEYEKFNSEQNAQECDATGLNG